MDRSREPLSAREFAVALGKIWLELTGLRPSLFRFRVWHMMVAVLVVALFIPAYRRVFYYNDEPDRSLLAEGDEVVVFDKNGDSVAIFPDPYDPDSVTMKREGSTTIRVPFDIAATLALPTGTKCVVVSDQAGDRDDCFNGNRLAGIEVVEGRCKGLVTQILRDSLRPR